MDHRPPTPTTDPRRECRAAQRGRAVSVWVLIAALGLAIAAACANQDAPSKGQWGGGIYVQQSWSVARAVSGHHKHVLQEKLACATCHAMSDEQMGPVTPERCATCHAAQAHIEHASAAAQRRFGASATSDCTSCHAFTLEGTGHDAAQLLATTPPTPADAGMRALPPEIPSYEEGDCKRCHAMQQGDVPAVQAHASQPCLACHRPHQDATPRSAPCGSCHEGIHTSHAAQGKSPEQACETCHQNQHAPAQDAVQTCAACHASEQPLIPPSATFAGGHTECISCHRPHEFGKDATVSCRSCHEQLQVLGGAHVAAHANCESCHQPHDVKATPEAACASCHKDVHSDHPGRGAGCIGCHDPHPEQKSQQKSAPGLAEAEPRACTSCHQNTGSEHGQHAGVACTGCHQPHHFGLEPTQLAPCTNCHGEHVQQVSTNPGHAACTGCHQGLPHHPEELEVGCDTCHRQESERVNAGHARCNECHEPHSGAQGAPCASCHAAESQTAPRGHQDCTGCHEPHAGSPAGKACSSCHADQAATPHGKLTDGCLTCHRPHGPDGIAQPPACTSCHELKELPGLHLEVKHQTCTNCHTGHEQQAAASREACLGCHSERKDHFPGGRCANCHLFTPTL